MSEFIESNALLAVMSDDDEEARALVESLLPGERRELENAARELAWLCHDISTANEATR